MSFIPPFDFREHIFAPWTAPLIGDTFWTVLMGALVAVACGWIGCYLILQGMSLLGDAISHTVLLGIVVGFLLTGQITGPAMFIGATVTGLITTSLIEALHTSSRIKEDAAIGIVFTSLFALGVVLLSVCAGSAHIDTQHVLYGDISLALLEKTSLGGVLVPVAVIRMAIVATCILGLIAAFFKELLVVAFDGQFAAVIGLRPRLVRYALMATLSITVVDSFSSVGAILVVAMLIAPAATAFLLTSRLKKMLAITTVVGCLGSLVGFHLAYWLSASTGGAMVCASCGLFSLAFIFSPRSGLLSAAYRRVRLRSRMDAENLIRALLKLGGDGPHAPVNRHQLQAALGVSPLRVRWTLFFLRRRKWIEVIEEAPRFSRLTELGAREARRLDRAHRLWETFLVDQVGLRSDHVHPTAEDVEHLLTEQLVEHVDDLLGHPDTDPHGTPIPRSAVEDQGPGIFQLAKLRVGDRARVVGMSHVSSGGQQAPAAPLSTSAAEIAALDLPLGQPFTILRRDAADPSWTLEFPDGKTVLVPHLLADQILVVLARQAPSNS